MQKRQFRLLICDDDQLFQLSCRKLLKDSFEVLGAFHSDEAKAIIKNRKVDIVLLDIQMRTANEGLTAIETLKAIDPEIDIVMLSGLKNFEVARQAMQKGAIDFISKCSEPAEILHSLQRISERRAMLQRQGQQNFETKQHQRQVSLVGQTPAILQLIKMTERIRSSSANVVITGETGSGKEAVARLLRGKNPDGTYQPFVAVDSATIHSQTAESILFGHEKGAFTGADTARKGIFEEANGGVVYFDEIANMTLEIQSKLLRAIQEREIVRLGSSRPIPLEFRVVAATNKKLEDLVKAGLFKEDLFQRLAVIPLQIPPLRDRKEDIVLLVEHFVDSLQRPDEKPLSFSPAAWEAIKDYDWPGNIRELSNLIAYFDAVSVARLIEVEDLPSKMWPSENARLTLASDTTGGSLRSKVAAYERRILVEAYEAAGGNISLMAQRLQVDRSHLHQKLRFYEIHSPQANGKRSSSVAVQ